ncbi:unnamed protein product [Gadus morhua 'NCC']
MSLSRSNHIGAAGGKVTPPGASANHNTPALWRRHNTELLSLIHGQQRISAHAVHACPHLPAGGRGQRQAFVSVGEALPFGQRLLSGPYMLLNTVCQAGFLGWLVQSPPWRTMEA